MDGSSAIWFGAPNFEVLDVVDDGHELVVAIESTMTVVGCSACGTRAKPKDRRWVSLRDAPASGRAVLLRWRKRIWSCPEPDCEVRTWTEISTLAGARRVLTTRACTWATDQCARSKGRRHRSPASSGCRGRRSGRRSNEPARPASTRPIGLDRQRWSASTRR